MPAKHSVKAKVAKAIVAHAVTCEDRKHLCLDFDSSWMLFETPAKAKSRLETKFDEYVSPVAVLPFATARQAREAVKVHNLDEEIRTVMCIDVWHSTPGSYYDKMQAVLSALGFPGSGRDKG